MRKLVTLPCCRRTLRGESTMLPMTVISVALTVLLVSPAPGGRVAGTAPALGRTLRERRPRGNGRGGAVDAAEACGRRGTRDLRRRWRALRCAATGRPLGGRMR